RRRSNISHLFHFWPRRRRVSRNLSRNPVVVVVAVKKSSRPPNTCGGKPFYLDLTPKGRSENGPHHSLADWARPHHMYGKGGMVEANGRYHAPACACTIHK